MKHKNVGERDIQLILESNNWKLRDDLKMYGGDSNYVELADGRLLCYTNKWDNKRQIFSDKNRKGYILDSVDDYISMMKPIMQKIALSSSGGTHVVVPHNYYFKTWDSTGATYIQDLLTVIPVKPELLDFSKESLLAIDKAIKREKLPDNVLEESIFLPAVVGYAGVHLERFQNRIILVDYLPQDDVYEPYYREGDYRQSLYLPFYEEVSENKHSFSIDEVVEVTFF